MKRLLLLLPLLLSACGITAPPRDNAQFETDVQGVHITWRFVNPNSLGTTDFGVLIGQANTILLGQSCVVDIDPTLARHELARVAAHKFGHCAQARYLLPGISRPDLGTYYTDSHEGFAQTYALAYLAACGDSLRPLGWNDTATATCTEAPDPRSIKRP